MTENAPVYPETKGEELVALDLAWRVYYPLVSSQQEDPRRLSCWGWGVVWVERELPMILRFTL